MAAANTFFQANPDHIEMRQNLEYYRMMAGVQEEDFKDLEARTHMVRENIFSFSFWSQRSLINNMHLMTVHLIQISPFLRTVSATKKREDIEMKHLVNLLDGGLKLGIF